LQECDHVWLSYSYAKALSGNALTTTTKT